MKKKSLLITLIGVVLVIIIIFFIQSSGARNFESINTFEGEITIYKSPNCGCCGLHAEYLKSRGGLDIEVIELFDMSEIKEQYKIPSFLQTCHTSIVGDYFVEGHVPLEAIDKLLTEEPDIAGIGIPGMPSGSPGMPGRKSTEFIVYAVDKNGSYSEFMRI